MQQTKTPTTNVTTDKDTTRDNLIDGFLRDSGLDNVKRTKIPGDASFRRYERIETGNNQFILMDAPPEKEDVRPFIKVDEILRTLELSAPEIINQDVPNGLLLLEDLGNKKFNKLFIENIEREEKLYKLATDVLVYLYKKRQRYEIAEYSREKLMTESLLFVEWYMPLFEKLAGAKKEKFKTEFKRIMGELFYELSFANNVLVLRDYHADNLMLIEERDSIRKVGLLDFQDALMGNPAYDLVSLLEDARRDVPKTIQEKITEYFMNEAGIKNKENFVKDYNILGAQRNLKILGIFSRLKVRDDKEVYLGLIPRVKEYLKQDLEHPACAKLKNFLAEECNL